MILIIVKSVESACDGWGEVMTILMIILKVIIMMILVIKLNYNFLKFWI